MNVIVIGGGVIGLGVAWELATRGAGVRLVERGRIGEGTTWAAAGILPAARSDTASDAFDRLRGLSHEAYRAWAARIATRTGIDVGWRRCGGVYLASTPGEAASLAGNLDYWRDLQIAARRLSPEQLSGRLPALAGSGIIARLRAAVEVEDECQVRPPDLLRGLAAVCLAAGVRIDETVSARLRRDGGRAICEIDGEDGPADADAIVLCGGVWTGQTAEAFGLGMSMVPIRGQVLLYRFDSRPFESVVNEGHRYLVPRDDGHVLVGSCEEEVGFQLGTTSEGLRMLAQWAAGVVPEIGGMQPVKSWSGLRPATFDGFPVIGAVPQVNNLYVASGHFRSGVHLAPATAVLVADLIERKPTSVDPSTFSVGRMVGQNAT